MYFTISVIVIQFVTVSLYRFDMCGCLLQEAVAAWRNTRRIVHHTHNIRPARTAATTTQPEPAGCSVSKPWVCTTQNSVRESVCVLSPSLPVADLTTSWIYSIGLWLHDIRFLHWLRTLVTYHHHSHFYFVIFCLPSSSTVLSFIHRHVTSKNLTRVCTV